MRKRLELGRLFVAAFAASLLLGGGWALGAPEPPPSDVYSPMSVYVPSDARPEAAARASALLERQATTPVDTTERPPEKHILASIESDMPITARPGGGKVIGTMTAGSRYFGVPHRAWIQERSKNGRFGKVAVPYSGTRATGWIRLSGLELSRTKFAVEADLSQHLIRVTRSGKTIMRIPAATGASASPTPPGRYFVTDLVPSDVGSSFGSFAFGISGIQTNLPAGWSGGDQLAIHGTNDPGSIGTAASAGCLRVSERALSRLKPLLDLGTPVTISR